MSEFHDDYPQYEFMAHHSEEEGKLKRRKLWNVFWIMLGITIVELIIGFQASNWGLLNEDRTSGASLKTIFIGLTLLKAFYIIFSFMHLGHEKRFFKWCVIAPYVVFIIYLIWISIVEAMYVKTIKEGMDPIIVKQKLELNEAAKSGHHDPAAGHNESEDGTHESKTEGAEPAETPQHQ